MSNESFRIVETIAEAESGTDSAIVVPTLRLDAKVKPLVDELTALSQSAETLSVWRSLHATCKLRKFRKEFENLVPRYRETLALCHDRMSQPVDRGTSIENAWLQGFSTALGTSALFQLQFAFQSVGEVLDRKAAYTLGAFSLHIAIFSLILSVVFGWLSIK